MSEVVDPYKVRVAREAVDHWSSPESKSRSQAHWVDSGRYENDEHWLSGGVRHHQIYCRWAEEYGRDLSSECRTMLEWGPGGGSNAVAFLETFIKFCGVDICWETLVECRSQVYKRCGVDSQVWIHKIGINNPEEVIKLVPLQDLFLCTAVFQHFPYPEYGLRVLSIARNVLKPSGIAYIQFRTPFRTSGWRKRRAKRYFDNVARFNLLRRHEFEEQAVLADLEIIEYPDGYGDERTGRCICLLRRAS